MWLLGYSLGLYSGQNNSKFLLQYLKNFEEKSENIFSRKNYYYTKFYLCEVEQ